MTRKTIYISNTEVHLDGSLGCMLHLSFYAMDDTVVLGEGGGQYRVLELKFTDAGTLKSAHILSTDESESIGLPKGSKNIKFHDIQRNSLFRLEECSKNTGAHIGGLPPKQLVLPQHSGIAPFQYIGTLSPQLEGLEWLPFDLHLSLPTLNYFGDLSFDYNNPLSPKMLDESDINGLTFTPSDGVDDEVISNLQVMARKINISSMRVDQWPDESKRSAKGYVGIPKWIQNPVIPICPESKAPMKFVCELSGRALIDWVDSAPLAFDQVRSMIPLDMFMFPSLVFYVFFAPVSKTVFITHQGT